MNCIEGMKEIRENVIDLVFADPPYNISNNTNSIKNEEKRYASINEDWDKITNYELFTLSWLMEAKRILKPTGSVLVWCSKHNMFEVGYILKQLEFQIKTLYTWHKTNAMPCLTGRNATEATEYVIWAVKDKNWTYNLNYAKEINDGKNIHNIIPEGIIINLAQTPPKEKLFGKHPTQKRLEGLTDILLQLHTNEEDLIVVPFVGSGTECCACKIYGRNFIGFETNKEYIELAQKRLDKCISINYNSRWE